VNPLRTLVAAARELPRLIPLMRNPAVPGAAKIAAVAAAALIVSPLDIFGDIPILGQIDDVVLLGYVIHLFVKFAEKSLANARVERNVTPAPVTGSALRSR
jgi:uncharacterized membrane protein YkvA (DUF1232 family)